ncbi:MAG: histone deacetylase [Desulfobacterales bacterium]|nr:histone deacetylase [Desulfobacterales bacterium]
MAIKIGIARDDRFMAHKTGHFHPEHPKRLDAIYRMLDRDFGEGLLCLQANPAPMDRLEDIHSPEHIQRVLQTAEQHVTNLAPDTPVSEQSYMAAWLAVGACLQGIDALINGECSGFFGLVRPPGHHAFANRAGGFCIFNNIAIAAKYAIKKHYLERILVVDWDVHHGNGLQSLFYHDPRLLYISTHDLMLYPYSGGLEQTGSDWGAGYTINAPISRSMTDNDIIRLYQSILMPVVRNFKPELIMVAAGFDAHRDDPLGRSVWTEAAYAAITRLIIHAKKTVGDPPIFLSLEGGYNPRALANCVRSVLLELIKNSVEIPKPPPANEETACLIEQLGKIHSQYGLIK